MAFTDDQIKHLKLMLELQASGYSDSINRLHQEIKDMKNIYDRKIFDLEKSLEFSQNTIDELQNKLKENDQIKRCNDENKTTIFNLQAQLNKQEDYTRKYNLRIDGLSESNAETSEQTQSKVHKLLKDHFDMKNVPIDTAHRIKTKTDNHRTRTVIVRLAKLSDRDFIMRNTAKLKNTNLYINEDLG